ncbi:MAG: AMP-binding protein [SAR324 cluster bacterium]|nr:AMP-binding protein [SAR324 cluster bacterium]
MREWFPKSTLGELPEGAARAFAGREALCFEGRRWSFTELSEDVDRAARALLALGIQPGEKVCLWLNNRPEFIHLMFAVIKIGAVLIPVNTRLRTRDVDYVLKQSNSSTLIAEQHSGPVNYLAMLHELLPGLPDADPAALAFPQYPDLQRVLLLGDAPQPGAWHWPEALRRGEQAGAGELARRTGAVSPDDTAYIMYTSGTTGFPKGVMHDHAVIRNVTDRINRMAITPQDVILMYLPLFHVFGFGEGPLVSMLSGARQVLTPTFDAEQCLELIERERVTIMHGFDLHFRDMMLAQQRNARRLSSLRTGLLPAGMHNATAIARKTQRELMPTLSCFGMSECGVGAGLSHLDSSEEQRCESSGYPAPGYQFRVIDPETGLDQPTGVHGEILVRGYMLMQGYYQKPKETAEAIDSEGWLHSGDMGLLRPDGCLRFMGRYKDMLKVGGENVDPMEVESHLLEHAGVHDVAVVGYPDERLGEVAVAFVMPAAGGSPDPQQLIDHCRGRIAGFKVPRHVLFVEEFPMTGSGKVRKVELRELALAQIKA